MPDMNDSKAKSLSPQDLANQLFDATLFQVQGNHREAALQVIHFLKEALVYAVMASAGGDDSAKKGLLRNVGESIVALGVTPPPTP